MLKYLLAITGVIFGVTAHAETPLSCEKALLTKDAKEIALSVLVISDEGGKRSIETKVMVVTLEGCPAPVVITNEIGDPPATKDWTGLQFILNPVLTSSGVETTWSLSSRSHLSEVDYKNVEVLTMGAAISTKDAWAGRSKPTFSYEFDGKKTEVYLSADNLQK